MDVLKVAEGDQFSIAPLDLLLFEVFFYDVALSVEDLEEFICFLYKFLFVFVNKEWPHDHFVESVEVFETSFVDTASAVTLAVLTEVGMQFFGHDDCVIETSQLPWLS